MAADQINFGYSQYVSGDGNTYCMKSTAEWTANADSGGAACSGRSGYGRASRNRSPRMAIYQDATTFRTYRRPVFTSTDFDALTIGTSTVAVHVPGETATVTYTLVAKIGEKLPSTALKGPSRPDHA